jgi:hypothetical protein
VHRLPRPCGYSSGIASIWRAVSRWGCSASPGSQKNSRYEIRHSEPYLIVRSLQTYICFCLRRAIIAVNDLQVRDEATVRCAGLHWAQVAPRQRYAEFIGSFAENSALNRAAVRLPEPCGRRRLVGARNMTVACDGGAGAQAGVRHRDRRRAAPTERRNHAPWPRFFESRPVQLAASHLVRAEATAHCRGRGRSAVQDRI